MLKYTAGRFWRLYRHFVKQFKIVFGALSHIMTFTVVFEKLKWHRFPTKDEDRKKKWASLVAKGRCEFVPTDNSRICSNHFPDGKPTNKNPNPVLYLTLDDYRRPKQINMRESPSIKRKASSCSPQQEKKQCSKMDEEDECSGNDNVNIAIATEE